MKTGGDARKIPKQDYARLARIARAATPGPWDWCLAELGLHLQSMKLRSDGRVPENELILIPRVCDDGRGCRPRGVPGDKLRVCSLMLSKEDRRFIATFNPETVLALIAAAAGCRGGAR